MKTYFLSFKSYSKFVVPLMYEASSFGRAGGIISLRTAFFGTSGT